MESYKFFSNKKCEYFPCHKVEKMDDFNCMFCYCPLYFMGDKCGGNFKILQNGIKDCSDCMIPHSLNAHDYIVNKAFEELQKMNIENLKRKHINASKDNGIYGISCKQQDWITFIKEVDTSLFKHIELNIYDVSSTSHIYDKEYLQHVIEVSEEKGISLSVHALDGINLGEKIERIRKCSIEIVAEAIKVAEYLRAKWVTIHLGTAGFSSLEKKKKFERLDIAIEAVNKAIAISETKNVKIAVENLYKYDSGVAKSKLGDSPEELYYVISKVHYKDRIAFVFDLGHANILSSIENEFDEYSKFLDDYMIAAHIHFNNGINDTHESLAKYEDECKMVLNRINAFSEKGVICVFESYSLQENLDSQNILEKNAKTFFRFQNRY